MTRPVASGYIQRRKQVIQMHRDGIGATEIARKMGVSRQSIYGILIRAGVLFGGTAPTPPAPEIVTISKEEEGSKNLLEAMIAYYQRHHWKEAA